MRSLLPHRTLTGKRLILPNSFNNECPSLLHSEAVWVNTCVALTGLLSRHSLRTLLLGFALFHDRHHVPFCSRQSALAILYAILPSGTGSHHLIISTLEARPIIAATSSSLHLNDFSCLLSNYPQSVPHVTLMSCREESHASGSFVLYNACEIRSTPAPRYYNRSGDGMSSDLAVAAPIEIT